MRQFEGTFDPCDDFVVEHDSLSLQPAVLREGLRELIDKHLKAAIKTATLELCCGDQSLRQRLLRAMQSLDGFLGRREEWPPALYARSQDISDEFKGAESVKDAIEAMDLPRVERLAERILHLYADCQLPSNPN